MPATHASSLQQTYAQIAEAYDTVTLPKINLGEMEQFTSLIKPGSVILDLGCGPGRDAAWFAAKGYKLTLFDLSTELLAIAKNRVPGATIIQGDMTELSFAGESFDGIWANASLLHLTKQEMRKVLAKLFLILRENGVLFCSVKGGEGEHGIVEDKYGKPVERFFSFYNEDELCKIIKDAGFSLISSRTTGSSPHKWVRAFAQKHP